MPRLFGSVPVLPGLPTQPYHAASKAYVDAGDALLRAHNQAPRTQSVAANANIDVGAAGDLQVSVTAGTPTLTPTNGQNGRTCIVECLASGGARTVNIAAAVVLTTGVTSRQLVIPSGKVGVFVIRYSTLGTAVYELASAYLRS